MASLCRPFVYLSLLALPLVACGDDGGENVPVPEGPHYGYVVSEAFIPTNNNQAREYGLDLGSSKGNKPDGSVDNQLGMVLGTLAGQGFELQASIDEAVLEGSIILLVDVQTKDFQNTTAAGISLKLGSNPTPAPCTDPQNPTPATCGKHLDGTGSFSIDPSSPDALVAGKIVAGTFTGGPGTISIQIALGGAEPVNLNLISARAKATGISENGITDIVLAGALTEDDLNSEVLPAIHAQLGPLITRDCPAPNEANCGCSSGTGRTILNLFDTNPKDCTVTLDEIKSNTLIQSLLSPDVCSKASCDKPDALSLGIKGKAVKATFPGLN